MAIDLTIMLVLGVVLDFFLAMISLVVLGNYVMPASLVSMLIIFIAVARWDGYGLVLSPILPLGVIFGACTIGGYFKAVYSFQTDWQFYLSIVLGYLSFGVNILFYKKFGTKKMLNETWKVILLILLNYALFCGVQYLSYTLLTLGKENELIYQYVNSKNETVTYLIYDKPRNGFIYNLLGLAIMFIGVFIFRSQGIVCNVKQKFIDDKRNAELDEADRKFTIEEVEEESSNESLEGNDDKPKEDSNE